VADLTLAMTDYDAAIRPPSHDSDLYYNRGLLFKAMNNPDRAIADSMRANNHRPRSATT